jgi:hypothetical protein
LVMVYPRTKVFQRRLEVTSLLVRGITPGEIAEVLEVPRQTVYNDVRVILSGRNKGLMAYARDEVIAQLLLNAQARWRYLWRLAETAESEHARVQAMRELRLNDEHIVNKLSAIEDAKNRKEEDSVSEEVIAEIAGLTTRVEALRDRRMGIEAMLIETLDRGDMEGLRSWLSDAPEDPEERRLPEPQ